MTDVNNRLHVLRGEHFRRAQNRKRKDVVVDVEHTPDWRAHALSLVIPAPPRVPSLTSVCLCVLATVPTHEFTQNVVPWLAPHLRRDLVRASAVHAPLSDTKLWPLYSPDGHAASELIVISPQASLRDDYFIRPRQAPDDWDAADMRAEPLYTLALVSLRLATSTVLSLPRTITHLALLDLRAPVPLHRLPATCPLLVVLDLSYNSWLSFERVDWRRWRDLRILGLRGCAVSSTFREELNRGRWDDIEVVQ